MPTVAGLQKHVGAHRAAGSANRADAIKVKDMGTFAFQTQCCLKTDDSDSEIDPCYEEGTAVQLVDALRVSKPAADAAGKPCVPPFVPRAPSEASTIFVP